MGSRSSLCTSLFSLSESTILIDVESVVQGSGQSCSKI